jgi:hypothetical protein
MSGRHRILWLAAAFVVLALGGWQAWLWLPHPDVAFYTTAAAELDRGARLYHEIGDVNAPPIYWLHGLAHALATLSGLAEARTPALLLLLFAAAVLLWCAVLAPAAGAPLWTLPLLAAALTFPALGSFAEREHWLLVGLLPYLFTLAAEARGAAAPGRSSLGAAALAGALALLKPPYFLLPILAAELWLAVRRRRLASLGRPEAWVAAAVFLLGVLLILVLHPAYLDRVLPQALDYYVSLGQPLGELLAPRGVWLPLLLLLATAGVGFAAPGLSALAGASAATALGFALAFFLQAKGFAYQWLPVLVLGSLAALLLVAAAGGRRRLFAAALLALPLWTGYVGWQQVAGRQTAWPETRALQAVLQEMNRGRERPLGLFALAPEIYPSFPAVTLAGVSWLNSESHLWQLDGLYRRLPSSVGFRAPAEQPPEERALRLALVGRFLLAKPDVVAVYRGGGHPAIGGSDFSYLEYYLNDPAFAEAWEGYVLRQRIGDYDLYAR